MTDDQIIATVRKILDVLHDPDVGFNAFRKELRKQNLTKDEYEQCIVDKEYELAAKYGITKQASRDEVKFRITGQDVMESHLYVSCGQAAKAFCYVHDKLVKNGEIKHPLNLRVLLSTDVEHLIDGMAGHTLPCVKMSDGKWHAIEPQIQPKKGEYPGFQFVCDDVKVGGDIWHLLESIKKQNRPYRIMKIVTWKYQETQLCDFARFLKESTIRKGKIGWICARMNLVLKMSNQKQYEHTSTQIYELCKKLDKNMPAHIFDFQKDGIHSYGIGFNFDGVWYEVDPYRNYLFMFKRPDLRVFDDKGYKLVKTMSPAEYITTYESIINQSKGRE